MLKTLPRALRLGCIDGGSIDDGATWLHVRHGGFGQVEHRVDVGFERAIELL